MEAFAHTDDCVRAIVKAVPQLPVVPAMFQELRRLLADPASDARHVAVTVQQDPSISAKVLQLANSVAFRRGAPIANIEAAVMRLGTSLISRLVMVEGVLATHHPVARFKFPEEARKYFVASLVAEAVVSPALRDEAALAVLLCPIGRLVMIAADPERMELVMLRAEDDAERLLAEELRLFGATHAEVGGYLIAGWGLPPAVGRAVGQQYEPLEDDEISAATQLANRDVRGIAVTLPSVAAFAAAWDRHRARVAFLEE